MQLNELVEVLDYLAETLKANCLEELYTDLIDEIDQYKIRKSKTGEQRIVVLVEALLEFLRGIVPQDWGESKLSVFTAIGADELLGKTSIGQMEKISKTPLAGYGALLKDLKVIREEVIALTKWIFQILAELKKIVVLDTPKTGTKEISQNDLVLKLIFKDKMKMKSMNQAVKFLSMWEKVFYYVSLLTKQKTKDVMVNVIGPDSPGSKVFVVELSYNKITVAAIVQCIIQAYDLYAGTLEIRKKILEIQKLNLENHQIGKALAEEEKLMIGRIAETITTTQMKEYAWQEEEFQKISKAIVIALKYILDYIDRGGEVDFYGSSSSEEHEEMHEKLFAARDKAIDLKLDIALLRC